MIQKVNRAGKHTDVENEIKTTGMMWQTCLDYCGLSRDAWVSKHRWLHATQKDAFVVASHRGLKSLERIVRGFFSPSNSQWHRVCGLTSFKILREGSTRDTAPGTGKCHVVGFSLQPPSERNAIQALRDWNCQFSHKTVKSKSRCRLPRKEMINDQWHQPQPKKRSATAKNLVLNDMPCHANFPPLFFRISMSHRKPPNQSGKAVCRHIRTIGSESPILAINRKDRRIIEENLLFGIFFIGCLLSGGCLLLASDCVVFLLPLNHPMISNRPSQIVHMIIQLVSLLVKKFFSLSLHQRSRTPNDDWLSQFLLLCNFNTWKRG
jgi:hypothetical protein